MVGFETSDDAAVYRLDDRTALLLTVDFFTPIVDDPYDFGRITAANSLSDVYAMGGRPLTAMNIVAFPCETGTEVLEEVLLGGYDKVHEAGAVLAGGHTIEDEEPKYGLAVMGTVKLRDLTTIRGARPGDLLILTKPIGTGLMTTALKGGFVSEPDIEAVVASMCALNAKPAAVLASHQVSAMTDVTGFGLAGHLYEMMKAGGTAARIWAAEVPLFNRALEMAASGMAPRTSAEECFTQRKVEVDTGGVDQFLVTCMFDPQTSGGLLAAVKPEVAEAALAELRAGPAPDAAIIGEVLQAEVPKVTIAHERKG